MSSDSVVLDIFFVRFPFGDPEVNGPLWREIDEQHLPAECRRRLLENGFRAGVIGGSLPVKLSELLELADKPAPSDQSNETIVADLVGEPTVQRRHLQIRTGSRGEIFASGVRDELAILVRDASGQISGQPYAQAQPLFAVKAFPEADGRVRLELVPEVQYGRARQRWVGDNQGMLRFEPSRERRVFERMAFDAILSPGHMLVMSSLPTRPGSVGHHFLTECGTGNEEQKLLIVRLSQTQHDDQFNPEVTLAVGE